MGPGGDTWRAPLGVLLYWNFPSFSLSYSPPRAQFKCQSLLEAVDRAGSDSPVFSHLLPPPSLGRPFLAKHLELCGAEARRMLWTGVRR